MAIVRTLTPRYSGSNRLLAASYVDNAAVPSISITNDHHGGCVDPVSLVVDTSNPSEPTIQLTPYVNSWTSTYWGWGTRLHGVNGTRPKIRPTDAERYFSISPEKIFYSYSIDGPYVASNTGVDLGAYHEFQFPSAFTQDSVYIWQQVPNTPNVVAYLAASVLASPYGHRIQADLDYTVDPTPGVIGTSVPQYSTMWWGKAIPNAPIYGFRIADDNRTTAGGKRRCITIAGQHAGEWNGASVHRHFVEWLINAQDGGDANQQAAYDLLGTWEFLMFPMMNPLGAYVGMHRGTPESGDGQTGWNVYLDPNRTWSSGSINLLDTHSAVNSAMIQAYPDGECNLAVDFHSKNLDDVAFFTNADAATCVEEQALLTAARGYDANYQAAVTPTYIAEAFSGWMDSDFLNTGPFTHCPVVIVYESGTDENFDEVENASLAAAFGRALLDRTIAGDYPPLPGLAVPFTGTVVPGEGNGVGQMLEVTHGIIPALSNITVTGITTTGITPTVNVTFE